MRLRVPALLLLLLAPAAAEDDLPGRKARPELKPEVRCAATLGLGGQYRSGGWVPLLLEAFNPTEDDHELVVQTSLAYGEHPSGWAAFSRPLDLPKGSRKRLQLHIRPLVPLESLRVECRSARSGLLVCAAESALKSVVPSRAFLVSVGRGGVSKLREGGAHCTVSEVQPAELPERPEGYDGVDWVLLRGSEWAEAPAALEALTRWLESGGSAAVSGPEALRALAASRLGKRLGLKLGEPARVEDPGSLGRDLVLREPALCEHMLCPLAEVLASSGDMPLLLSAGLGSGELLLFALDPDLFRDQVGYAGLWRGVLGLPPPRGEETGPDVDALQNWGRAVLDGPLFHRQRLEIDWLWWFLAAYILLVGPLDWLLIRRLGRWRLAGLATLGLWAAGGSWLCYHLGATGLFTRTMVSRVGVVDAFPTAGRAAGRSLTSLFPNRNGLYDLGMPGASGSAAVVVDPEGDGILKSGLLASETLSWEESGSSLELKEAKVYYGIQKIFEQRWAGPWKGWEIRCTEGPGGWTLENRSPATLRSALDPALLIPPGGRASVGAPTLLDRAPPRTDGELQGMLGAWLVPGSGKGGPPGLPLRLACRTPAWGFLFWAEGLPLGFEGLDSASVQDAVLVRVHID